MHKTIVKYLPALAWLAMTLLDSSSAHAEDPVKRGEYLVHVISCGDCHTPGSLAGKPDMARYLGGSSIGFQIPGLGIFYAPNLTPDTETGLAKGGGPTSSLRCAPACGRTAASWRRSCPGAPSPA